jgi:lysophospholipase L1-like esterase
MKLIIRFSVIIILIYSYSILQVYEPFGIKYLISIVTLGCIAFEIKKIWNLLEISDVKKIKLKKIMYLFFVLILLVLSLLIMHKDAPAGNIRYVRILMILSCIGVFSKIINVITKSSISNVIKNTSLVLFSTISFIAILEICFMFLSLSHGSGEAYSGKIWGRKYWNPINKFGFRDENPKKGKNTIFFVGDSFTAGWGVKKIEDRFGETMASELKKKGITINEINLGRYGADTHLEFHILKKFIEKSNILPNQIFLQYFVNDMDKYMPSSSNCTQYITPVPSWKKQLIEGSYLVNYLNGIYPTININTLPKECDYIEKLKKTYNTDSIWKKEECELNKFKTYCNKYKIKLNLVFFPFMEDLSLAKKANIEGRIKKYCSLNNIAFINVTSYIKHLSRDKRQVSIVDAHASAEVHNIIGKVIAKKIKI